MHSKSYESAEILLVEVDLRPEEFGLKDTKTGEFEYRQFNYGSTSFVTKEDLTSNVVVGATIFSAIVDDGRDAEKTLVNAYQSAIITTLLFGFVGDLSPKQVDKAFNRLALFGRGHNFMISKTVESETFTFRTKYSHGMVIIDVQSKLDYLNFLRDMSNPEEINKKMN